MTNKTYASIQIVPPKTHSLYALRVILHSESKTIRTPEKFYFELDNKESYKIARKNAYRYALDLGYDVHHDYAHAWFARNNPTEIEQQNEPEPRYVLITVHNDIRSDFIWLVANQVFSDGNTKVVLSELMLDDTRKCYDKENQELLAALEKAGYKNVVDHSQQWADERYTDG